MLLDISNEIAANKPAAACNEKSHKPDYIPAPVKLTSHFVDPFESLKIRHVQKEELFGHVNKTGRFPTLNGDVFLYWARLKVMKGSNRA